MNRDVLNTPDQPQPEVVQTVTSTGGVAYGVIGADLHVFGDGVPLYLLHEWSVPRHPDSRWLRQLPSRLLNARFEVVEFTGRAVELTQLHKWRQQSARLAVRWLHGEAGVGKTRLATQFANQCLADGWKVVTATHGSGSVLSPLSSQDMCVGEAAGVILIVDYADRWPHSHLTWLFSNSVLHQPGTPTRILLLGRSTDAWPAVRGALASQQVDTSSQLLPSLPGGVGSRLAMFTAARDSFAHHYHISDPQGVQPPDALQDPEMGLPLALHMAALVAVDTHTTSRRPPADMAGLTVYLLDREHQYWATLYGDPNHSLDSRATYSTPPQVMNQTVFTAALTGAIARETGTVLLQQIGVPSEPGKVLSDHAMCYPASADSDDQVLEPLYPDRLAEDFLALTMPGHPADYPAQPWADKTTATVLINGYEEQAASYLPRAVTFLAAAASRWPHLGPSYLYPLLLQYPHLAITAGSAALSALAAIEDIDIDVLETIDRLMPDGTHVDLDVGSAALCLRLTPHRLAATTDPALRARLYADLADRLDRCGRQDEALIYSQHTIAIRRVLAQAHPSEYLPNLAMSLGNHARRLWALGHRQKALTANQEALTIWRRLPHRNLTDYLVGLAPLQTNLGVFLATLGRQKDAVSSAEHAVEVCQRLADISPDAHMLLLAMSLIDLGAFLSDMERWEDALEPTQRAADLYRQLAKGNPAAHLPGLAASLNNLGLFLSTLKRPDEALFPLQEAVAVSQQLAEINQAAYVPQLATAKVSLGSCLLALGQLGEALSALQQAVKMRQRLAQNNPAAHEPDLADSLVRLSICMAQLGCNEAAVTHVQGAVGIYQRWVEIYPDSHLPQLAGALARLGHHLSTLGRHNEALPHLQQSVALYRQLVQTNPEAEAHQYDLACGLLGLSQCLAGVGRWADAGISALQAVDLNRQLPRIERGSCASDLAEVRNSVSSYLSELASWLEQHFPR